jgi:hypothetical protein
MRFHLLGLANVPTNKIIQTCAYTQKILKLARILMGLGHVVTFYGGEGSEVECSEFVEVLSSAERRAVYGEWDWTKQSAPKFGNDPAYQRFNERTIREINARKNPIGDILLCTMGNYQKPVSTGTNLWNTGSVDMYGVESNPVISGATITVGQAVQLSANNSTAALITIDCDL